MKTFALREVICHQHLIFKTRLHAKFFFRYSSLTITHLLLIIFIGLVLELSEVYNIQILCLKGHQSAILDTSNGRAIENFHSLSFV